MCSPAPARYRARLLAVSPDHLVRRKILGDLISLWLSTALLTVLADDDLFTCIRGCPHPWFSNFDSKIGRSAEALAGWVVCPLIMKAVQPGCVQALTAVATARLVPDPRINNGFPAERRRDVCFARAGGERPLQAGDPAMRLRRAMVTSSPLAAPRREQRGHGRREACVRTAPAAGSQGA